MVCAVAAIGAATWSLAAFGPALRAAPFQFVGKRLGMGDSFQRDALELMNARLDGVVIEAGCNTSLLKGAALIRANLAALALAGGEISDIERRIGALDSSARALLRCSPYQGIAWFALYWTTLNREGVSPAALSFLAMSYAVSPREAWIALMRNNLAMQVADLLPGDVQDRIFGEWSDLARSGLLEQAAAILARAPPASRQRLVERTAALDQTALKWFSRYLDRLGVDIELPTLSEDPRRAVR